MAGDDPVREFQRQTRIAAQASFLLAGQMVSLLLRGRLIMLFVLLSHKWLRWIAGIWIPVGVFALARIFPPAAIGLFLAGVIGAIGWWTGARWAKIPAFFLIVHAAYLRGLWHALKGDRYVVWKPRAG